MSSLAASLRTAITNAGGTPNTRSLRGLLQQLVTAYGGSTFPDNDHLESLLKAAIIASGSTPTATKFRPLLAQLVTARGGVANAAMTPAQLGSALVTAGGFIPVTGAALSAVTLSNIVTMIGLPGSVAITITGGEYSKNGGAYTTSPGTVTNGDTVRARVTASGSYSTAVVATLTINGIPRTFTVTTLAVQVPAQVGTVTPTPGNAQVALAWTAPANGGSAITDYLVEYKLSASGTWLTFADGVSSSTGATVTGLTNSSAYDFRVSAINAVGTGTASAVASSTPVAAPAFTALPSGFTQHWNYKDLVAGANGNPTVANGAAVSTWKDRVAGVDAAQATSGLRPIYQVGFGVDFRAGSKVLDAGRPADMVAAVAAGAYTEIVIVRNVTTQVTAIVLSWGTTNATCLKADGTSAGGFNGPGAYTWPAGAAPVVIGLVNYPSAATLGSSSVGQLGYLNGTCFGGSTSVNTTSSGNFCFGAFADGTQSSKVIIQHVLFWPRSLTPAEMLQVQKWYCDDEALTYAWVANSNKFHIFHGDSLMFGQTKSNNIYSAPAIIATNLSLPLGTWTQIGIPGATIAQLNTITGPMIDAIPPLLGTGVTCSLSYFEWYNSRNTTASIPYGQNNGYLSDRKTANPGANLKIIFGTSTDSGDATTEAGRAGYNAYYDANAASNPNINYYAAIHLNADIGPDGTSTNTTYFNADQIHLTGTGSASGYRSLASVFQPHVAAVQAL